MGTLSRADIAAMTKEDRAKFMVDSWKLIKEACDKVGGDTVQALKNMKPSLYGIGGTSVGGASHTKWKELTDKFQKVGDTVNEMDLFKTMKIGEKEAHVLIKTQLKSVEASQRKWIEFKNGNYILKGIGATEPQGVITVKFSEVKKVETETKKVEPSQSQQAINKPMTDVKK